MKLLSRFSLLLVTLSLSLSAQALNKSAFDRTEYSFGVTEPAGLPIAPSGLGEQRAGFYDFIDFEDGHKEKLVTYLDTPDRQFAKNDLIIRVREDLRKPSKSKITIKLRAPSPEKFGDVKKYKKAEIDIVNGANKYSVSYDIKFKPNKIDVMKVDIAKVFKRIKKKSPDAWALLKPVYEKYADKIEQTIVMRALQWEGPIKGMYGDIEAEFVLWSPYYKWPKVGMPSVSFKGYTSDGNLKKAAKHVRDTLAKKGILSDSTRSKTETTYKLSKNFN